MNGKRVLANVVKREKETSERKISRNMQYTNGAWGDSHR